MAHALSQLGASCHLLPAITITATELSPPLKNQILNIDHYARVIVVSAHAAEYGLTLLDQYWPQWPVDIEWFAIGQKTARLLANAGITAQVAASGIDSEALLSLPCLQAPLEGKTLIWRGSEGRETLRDTLIQLGSEVEYASLYQRSIPEYSAQAIYKALDDFNPDLIVALSGETLHNLLQLSHNNPASLIRHTVLVPGERVASLARSLGFAQAIYPQAMDEESINQAIVSYYQQQKTIIL